jgi:hypothetical protein
MIGVPTSMVVLPPNPTFPKAICTFNFQLFMGIFIPLLHHMQEQRQMSLHLAVQFFCIKFVQRSFSKTSSILSLMFHFIQEKIVETPRNLSLFVKVNIGKKTSLTILKIAL